MRAAYGPSRRWQSDGLRQSLVGSVDQPRSNLAGLMALLKIVDWLYVLSKQENLLFLARYHLPA